LQALDLRAADGALDHGALDIGQGARVDELRHPSAGEAQEARGLRLGEELVLVHTGTIPADSYARQGIFGSAPQILDTLMVFR